MKRKFITRIITALLTVIICFSGIPAFSADTTDGTQSEVEFDLSKINLDDYGDVITNEELGFNLSSTGFITKRELKKLINSPATLGASSSTTISLTYCYDTSGNVITAVSSTDFRNAGAIQYRFTTSDGLRVYCIEPGVYIAGGVSLSTASNEAWDSLTYEQKRAINTALCYGLEGSPEKVLVGNINTDQAYIATQLIIWEIVKGERSADTPFSLNAGKSGYLNLYCAGGKNPNIKAAYNNIVSRMSKYWTVPSFTHALKSKAQTITLDASYNEISGEWTYGSKTLNDSNGVLSDFDFAGTYDVGNATVKVTQSGNSLTFTCYDGDLNGTATEVSAKSEKTGIPTTQQGVLIAYGSPSMQDVVGGGSIDPPNAYMKLSVNIKSNYTRDARIQKSCWTQSEADDDTVMEGTGSLSTAENLSGWYFKVEASSKFKEKYGVDTFILGPTDATGFTQSLSEYIMANIDPYLTYDVPLGTYEFIELGKLKDGATGADLENDYYFPEGWRADNKVNVDGETFTGLINFSGAVNKIDNIGYATNIFDIPFKLNKVNADSASAKDFYFTATNKETGDVYLLRTDSNGNAYISSDTSKSTTIILPEGTYTIHELGKLVSGDGSNYSTDYAVPEIYDTPTDFDVEISADAYKAAQESGLDAIERTVVNTVSAYIEILKKDKDTGYTLADAVFGIYYDKECTSLLEAVTTNAYGKGKTEGKYATGTYYVQEITAPQGYRLDKTIHTVNVEPKLYTDYTVTITATNEKYPTKVQICKTDEETNKPLEGVVFGVYSDEACSVLLEEVTTDEDGYALTSTYKPTQTIYIKEISTVTGYVLSDEVTPVEIVPVTSTKTVALNFTNARERITLTGQKTWNDYDDIMGYRPDEITVNLYDSADMNTVIQSVTTTADDNWQYEFTNLYKYNENGEEIVYTVVEDEVDYYTAKVTGVNLRNSIITGSVTLTKNNGTDEPLKDVTFELYKADGTKLSVRFAGGSYIFSGAEDVGVTEISTDAAGRIIVNSLPVGSYYFLETNTLDGYMPYVGKINFRIEEGSDSTLNPSVSVKNNRTLMFNTGGNGDRMIYILAAIIGFFAIILIAFLLTQKSKKGKIAMKKMFSFLLAVMLIGTMIFGLVPCVSAETKLDLNTKTSFALSCDRYGYEFSVYNVGSLVKTSNPYEVKYTSNIAKLKDPILNGDSAALLSALDELDESQLGSVVGIYNSTTDGAVKTFTNQAQGIYYVRATNYPAGVKSVTNSVFALPYYTAEDGWVYEIEAIPLASKVVEDVPEIVKAITNSTKDNVNFTDVSLGDTVEFEIKTTPAGSYNTTESRDFRLKSYVITDNMSKGLTLDPDSFAVKLTDANGNTVATLDKATDYVVDIKATLGADTDFTVSLTESYLQEAEFYKADVANVVTTYSAVLNKYATTAFEGNPNEAVKLTYSNKNGVTAEVEGNTVYAYTYGVRVHKQDDDGKVLADAQFALYLSKEEAEANTNAIATGTSDANGLVEFKNANGEVVKLSSGTYYITETKAPEGYNRYTAAIEVKITAEYSDVFANGTWISSAPENGIAEVTVTDTKVIYPQTGSVGDTVFYALGGMSFVMMLSLLFFVYKRKKATSVQ